MLVILLLSLFFNFLCLQAITKIEGNLVLFSIIKNKIFKRYNPTLEARATSNF